MLQGSLQFSNLLNRWSDNRFDRIPHSKPFWYLVASDSFRSVAELEEYYTALQQIYSRYLSDNPTWNYLGDRPATLLKTLDAQDIQSHFPADLISTGYASVELAINVDELTVLLRDLIKENPLITFLPNRRVEEVRRNLNGFSVQGMESGKPWTLHSDQIVNALWDGRLRIDRDMDLSPETPWVYRLKYRVLVELPQELRKRPSVTYVQGAYGDVVVHPDGTGYVSWYPECMRGWSLEIEPPKSWELSCRGEMNPDEAGIFASRILSASDVWFPGLARARPRRIDAGIIFAWGNTDITDPGSELHSRFRAGITSVDGFHSIDTGKFTTAPIFAVETVNRVLGKKATASLS
jgi:hypothetical protein